MELTHDFTVAAPVDHVWATFMDLERVGGCFPGATVDSVTEDGFSGTVKVKLGPIALVYLGSGSFLARDDADHHAIIEAKGKDKRGNGTAGATVTIHLTPSGGGTRVDVTTDLAITGKPAQFGRGVMQDVSDKLLQQFVACIAGQLAAEPSAEAASESLATTQTSGSEASDDGRAAPDGDGTRPASDAGVAAANAPSSPRPAATTQDDSIDLGATVLPVVLRAYAPHLAVGLLGVLIGWALGRRQGA
ncbi:MAG: SRPBCC family protein [Tetrasphaera sp.]